MLQALFPMLTEHAAALLSSGWSREVVLDEVEDLVDDLVDWSELIEGPLGVQLEAIDGTVARMLATAIVDAVPDRETRAARLQARAAELRASVAGGAHGAKAKLRRAQRKERRADRLLEG